MTCKYQGSTKLSTTCILHYGPLPPLAYYMEVIGLDRLEEHCECTWDAASAAVSSTSDIMCQTYHFNQFAAVGTPWRIDYTTHYTINYSIDSTHDGGTYSGGVGDKSSAIIVRRQLMWLW